MMILHISVNIARNNVKNKLWHKRNLSTLQPSMPMSRVSIFSSGVGLMSFPSKPSVTSTVILFYLLFHTIGIKISKTMRQLANEFFNLLHSLRRFWFLQINGAQWYTCPHTSVSSNREGKKGERIFKIIK